MSNFEAGARMITEQYMSAVDLAKAIKRGEEPWTPEQQARKRRAVDALENAERLEIVTDPGDYWLMQVEASQRLVDLVCEVSEIGVANV